METILGYNWFNAVVKHTTETIISTVSVGKTKHNSIVSGYPVGYV